MCEKNKNESLGQIININELYIKGGLFFKNQKMAILYTKVDYLYYIKEYQQILKQLLYINFIVKMKKLQEAWEPKFCKSTIIYYYPSDKTKEKNIFKNKHPVSCDSLHAKCDANIVAAVDDWQTLSFVANDLLNSKNY